MPTTPTAAAAHASSDSGLGLPLSRGRMRAGYNPFMSATEGLSLPRWIPPLLVLAALVLAPWTLWLTYSLPSSHVTHHYDLAWIVFDVFLLVAFAVTGVCAFRGTRWLAPAAAATGTMLLCDAWFDVVTSAGGGERLEALLEAIFVELPLAILCGWIVWDTERFLVVASRRRTGVPAASRRTRDAEP